MISYEDARGGYDKVKQALREGAAVRVQEDLWDGAIIFHRDTGEFLGFYKNAYNFYETMEDVFGVECRYEPHATTKDDMIVESFAELEVRKQAVEGKDRRIAALEEELANLKG